MAGHIQVKGVERTQRALKNAGAMDDRKELRAGLKRAADVVVADAKGRVPLRSGTAAGSLGSGVTAKGAFVVGGKKKVPYYGWLDFGNRSPKSGRSRSVGPWAKTGKGPKKGRFIYPALDAKREEVTALVSAAVRKALDSEGLGK